MGSGRDEYVKVCKDFVDTFSADKKMMVQYVRDKKGRAKGVVVAYRHPRSGEFEIGWSLCNTKAEKFDKYIGLNKAINRAVSVRMVRTDSAAQGARNVFERMLGRVEKIMEK